jgi:hypothetical protein
MIEALICTETVALNYSRFRCGRLLSGKAALAVRYASGTMLVATLMLGAVPGARAQFDDFSDGTDGAAAIDSPPAANPAPASPPNVTGPVWTHLNGELVSSGQAWDASTGELRMTAPDNGYIADEFGNQYGFTGSYVSPNYQAFSVSVDVVEPTGSPGATATGYLFGLTARGTGDNTLGGWSGYLFGYNQSLNGVPLRIEITKVRVPLSTGVVASAPVALDLANKNYTLKLTAVGSLFTGEVFEVGSTTPLATAMGFDNNLRGVPPFLNGYAGLFGLSATPYGDVDVTFDNFNAQVLTVGGPADFNINGTIDAGDYALWRKLNGPPDQYTLWRSSFGNSPGSGSGISNDGTVPEPATAALVFLGLIGLCFRRRGLSR